MDVCTGAACFKAYNHDQASFAQYASNRPELAASSTAAAAASTAPRTRDAREDGTAQVGGRGESACGHLRRAEVPHFKEILAQLDQYRLPYELGTHG
jgi:anti-sigma factor ChrR (cupin superfamily)